MKTRMSDSQWLAALIVLLAVSLAPPNAAAGIRIGIIGDQTGATDLDHAYQVLQQGVGALNALSSPPNLVLHVGDIVESTQSEADIRTRFQQATQILNRLKAPWYATAGDHDVNPPVFKQNSQDRSRETLFKQLYSQINPKVANNLYYSFDAGGYHFIVLYALEHLHTDPRWGNAFYSRLSDQQQAWLQQDLRAYDKGKKKGMGGNGIIVLLHQPMWYLWSNGAPVHELLAQYPVKAVIAGHFHYNQQQVPLNGIHYRVVGATGGDTKQGNPNSGDLQHVTLMTVDEGGVQFQMIPLAPFVQTGWTEQHEMDRVQALDQILGNLWSFPTDSPIYLDGGKLVKACGSTAAAQLVVKNIGNPLPEPVDVAINVNAGSSIQVSGGSFGTGLCQGNPGSFNCTLNESAGVAVSNTSMVELSQYPPPPPLWTGTLTLSGTPPAIGTAVQLQLLTSYQAGGQTYMIHHDASTIVQSCGK